MDMLLLRGVEAGEVRVDAGFVGAGWCRCQRMCWNGNDSGSDPPPRAWTAAAGHTDSARIMRPRVQGDYTASSRKDPRKSRSQSPAIPVSRAPQFHLSVADVRVTGRGGAFLSRHRAFVINLHINHSHITLTPNHPITPTMPPPPAVLVDTTSDFTTIPTTTTTTTAPPPRTLLLCPPSISSTPHILESALSTLSRDSTDVQMLDRLSLNLATLPEKTYDSVILLPSSSSTPDLNPAMFDRVFASMVPGAKWRSRDNLLGGCEKLVLLMAGFLVEQENGSTVLVKPDIAKSVPLRPRKKGDWSGVTAPPKVVDVPAPVVAVVASISGVGYVDYGDVADDEELIDEDDLGDDLAMPMQQRMHP